jgi:hypothetical protein
MHDGPSSKAEEAREAMEKASLQVTGKMLPVDRKDLASFEKPLRELTVLAFRSYGGDDEKVKSEHYRTNAERKIRSDPKT